MSKFDIQFGNNLKVLLLRAELRAFEIWVSVLFEGIFADLYEAYDLYEASSCCNDNLCMTSAKSRQSKFLLCLGQRTADRLQYSVKHQ